MQGIQNLIDELVSGYIQSKYDREYLKEKINEILEFILPEIAILIKNRKEKDPVKLWNAVKEDEKIKNLFRKTLKKVERPIVIYVASKFENNQYFGVKIIEEALRWK
ncbi:MAG: hypothetical protein AB1467_00235 [Candidatus Diapherotrites archaeon]